MTCRAARLFPNDIQLKPVTCGECGSTELQLKQVGHVCPICAQSMLEHQGRGLVAHPHIQWNQFHG